ncbi:ABC-type glycerol-3-phosphate transport system substrate-binding protein [Pullulanibacillus pueri]|uniref:ABC transporter n=1 Tax=Pullulanibacillus pueri TaxID=1437324 RepID=A0A8J3EL08_9BACL|nr:extracellular solute-binding protein [Pullulanibacillus pueri]MBM7681138.1 ABC-type glycerol-3-phosphate transport system substrate-binding protein [Pullulanibacillus pueri]GGH77193.1 ABC transporter [Pullulanibacillus pueri]
MKKSFKLLLMMMLIVSLTALTACQQKSEKTSTSGKDGPITIKVLHNWAGSKNNEPDDLDNNPVAKKILEKTGVKMTFDYPSGTEVEKITQVLATGQFPDLYTGPAWGKESETLLDAANQGLLYDLTPYLKKYPNLANLVKKENMSPSLYDSIFSKQKGGQFMLHAGYPATSDDVVNWLYGLYVNKDIAKKVGIDPQSVHTPDDLYKFLKAVKDQNLKVNGKPVFPLGAGANGWPLDIMSEMFVPVAGASSWKIDDNGNAKLNFLTPEYEDYILYMQKLRNDGLLDPEAYTQTGAIADEKFAQGRYAVIPNQFPGLWSSAVKAGLQDKYVPLGPLNDFNGDPYRTEVNVTGSQLIAVPKTVSKEKLDAIMKMLNYLASDEGFLLTNYGIEGVHYEKVDGKIKAKKEWVDKLKDDPKALINEGIGGNYATMAGMGRTVSLAGGAFGYQYDPRYKAEDKFKKIMSPDGIKPVEGKDPYSVFKETDQYEQIQPVFDTLGDVVLQAIHSKTKDEAIKVIEESRKALKNAGIDTVDKELTKQAKSGTEFIKYRTSN